MGRILLCGFVIALVIIWLCRVFFGFGDDTYMKKENKRLKQEVKVLDRKVNESLVILNDIRKRDDNFYRVMLRMDPMSIGQRYAGLATKDRYTQYQGLSNADAMIQLKRNIVLLDRLLYAQSVSFDELRSEALNQHGRIDHVPSVIPMDAGNFTISAGYGYRVDPLYGGTRFHPGMDLKADAGTPVHATASGTVTKASVNGSYGNCVEIDHGFNYTSLYAHLSDIRVNVGDNVERGDVIATSGNTGKSTAPHLHYEVRFKGESMDPVNYFFLGITPEQYLDFIDLAANAGYLLD